MTEPRNVQRCRWAEPTLFQESPLWTQADDYPWSCKADGDPHVVEDTGVCATCGRWAPRGPEAVASPFDRAQGVPFDSAQGVPEGERCHCQCSGDCCDK